MYLTLNLSATASLQTRGVGFKLRFGFADEINFARNCEDLGIDNLGYSCEALISQQIKESEPSRKQLGF